MANTPYANFYLSNEIEDQLNSKLNLERFVTVDTNLVGTAGMTRKINVYSATTGKCEKLTKGNGNTKTIEAGYTQTPYTIALAQDRFKYFDEEAMEDPLVVVTGVRQTGTELVNTMQADIYGEFDNATLTLTNQPLNFGTFVDAVALMNLEAPQDVEIFAIVSPADVATIRKQLKDDLKYVEAFSRNGYIGSVASVNIYTKKDATPGTVYVATKEAVTLFVKTGTEVEQERDANTRENTVYARKYYIAAFTDATKCVKVTI